MFIFAFTPLVALSFPALTPLILASAGALGYKAMVDTKDKSPLDDALRQALRETTTVRARVEDTILDSMEEEVRRGEMLIFEKENIRLAVTKDERGKLTIYATGPESMSKRELEEAGREFAEELAQMFAFNRAVNEVQRLNAEVVEETVNEQGEMVLRVRRYS